MAKEGVLHTMTFDAMDIDSVEGAGPIRLFSKRADTSQKRGLIMLIKQVYLKPATPKPKVEVGGGTGDGAAILHTALRGVDNTEHIAYGGVKSNILCRSSNRYIWDAAGLLTLIDRHPTDYMHDFRAIGLPYAGRDLHFRSGTAGGEEGLTLAICRLWYESAYVSPVDWLWIKNLHQHDEVDSHFASQ